MLWTANSARELASEVANLVCVFAAGASDDERRLIGERRGGRAIMDIGEDRSVIGRQGATTGDQQRKIAKL